MAHSIGHLLGWWGTKELVWTQFMLKQLHEKFFFDPPRAIKRQY